MTTTKKQTVGRTPSEGPGRVTRPIKATADISADKQWRILTADDRKRVLVILRNDGVKKKARGKPFAKGNEFAFKPGQSGNPAGRPKVRTLSDTYRTCLAEK